MDFWKRIAERKIQEAMADGAFDGLEGSSRPISLEENRYEDSAQRTSHGLLENRDLDSEIERLKAAASWLAGAELERRAAELNRPHQELMNA